MEPLLPRWLTYDRAVTYSSLSHTYLETLTRTKAVKSRYVKLPGSSRGRRLIDRLSLDEFIETSEDEMTAIAMNANTPKIRE